VTGIHMLDDVRLTLRRMAAGAVRGAFLAEDEDVLVGDTIEMTSGAFLRPDNTSRNLEPLFGVALGEAVVDVTVGVLSRRSSS